MAIIITIMVSRLKIPQKADVSDLLPSPRHTQLYGLSFGSLASTGTITITSSRPSSGSMAGPVGEPAPCSSGYPQPFVHGLDGEHDLAPWP